MKKPLRIVFGSGKGGVGRSLTCANVGMYLASLGHRVLVVDGCLGAGTLHAFLGIDRPTSGVAMETAVRGLSFWPASDEPGEEVRARLSHADADVVLVDGPAGTGQGAMDWLSWADKPIVMFTPDPPAVELTYALLRRLFAYRAGVHAPPLEAYRTADRDERRRLRGEMHRLEVELLVSQVRSKADMDLGPSMAVATRRTMALPARSAGHVEYDDAAWASCRRAKPLLLEHPESRIARCFEKLSRLLWARAQEPPRCALDLLSEETHYELLDAPPTATEEDLRRAYRRARDLWAADSVVVRGLYTPPEHEAFYGRLATAYEVLMNPVTRREYDEILYPEGVPRESPETVLVSSVAAAKDTGPRPPMPELGDAPRFTGDLLRAVREARGLSLREISERTKIGLGHLSAIEDEAFGELPATVYVRGFLTQYAKMLDLDGMQVIGTYLPRLAEQRATLAPR